MSLKNINSSDARFIFYFEAKFVEHGSLWVHTEVLDKNYLLSNVRLTLNTRIYGRLGVKYFVRRKKLDLIISPWSDREKWFKGPI